MKNGAPSSADHRGGQFSILCFWDPGADIDDEISMQYLFNYYLGRYVGDRKSQSMVDNIFADDIYTYSSRKTLSSFFSF